MGPAPPDREVGVGAIEIGEDVDVGKVAADEQGGGGKSRAPAQPAAGQAGADQRMADWVYASLASSSSWTFPLSAPDTGQPSRAVLAALAKPA